MKDASPDNSPIVSRHRTERRSKATSTPEPGPEPKLESDLKFTLPYPTHRRKSVPIDLTAFPRPKLAREAAHIILKDWREGTAFRSPSSVEAATQMLARLAEFLNEEDGMGQIKSFGDFTPGDVDSFDLWLHQERFHSGSVSPYARLGTFKTFLGRAVDEGYADEAIRRSTKYVSVHHDAVSSPPRDGYDDFVMSGLRKAATAGIDDVLKRMEQGWTQASRGLSPFEHGWSTPANFLWLVYNERMITQKEFDRLERYEYKRHETTVAKMLDQSYLRIVDCVPFLVALGDATGLPPECLHDLKANCLDTDDPEAKLAWLSYVKRRQHWNGEPSKIDVANCEPYSAGWIIRQLLRITAPARRDCSFGENEGPLFISRVGSRIAPTVINAKAVAAWYEKNRVPADKNGNNLEKLVLSRIRKSVKAKQYSDNKGRVARSVTDHTKAVFVRHYASIPLLMTRHEEATAAGLQQAHDEAVFPHVLVGQDADRLKTDPAGVAKEFCVTIEQVRRAVEDGSSDLWVAGCLSFENSPFAEPGRPCGAPLLGCLNCANAVVTKAKLPNLIRLLDYVVAKRQELNLGEWATHFGFVYTRIFQILNLFPADEVAEAAERAKDDTERTWPLAALAVHFRTTGDA